MTTDWEEPVWTDQILNKNKKLNSLKDRPNRKTQLKNKTFKKRRSNLLKNKELSTKYNNYKNNKPVPSNWNNRINNFAKNNTLKERYHFETRINGKKFKEYLVNKRINNINVFIYKN